MESRPIVGSIEIWSSNFHAKKIFENSRRGQKVWWASPSHSNWFTELCKWLYLSDSNSLIKDGIDDYAITTYGLDHPFSVTRILFGLRNIQEATNWDQSKSGVRIFMPERLLENTWRGQKVGWASPCHFNWFTELRNECYTFLMPIHWFQDRMTRGQRMVTMYLGAQVKPTPSERFSHIYCGPVATQQYEYMS